MLKRILKIYALLFIAVVIISITVKNPEIIFIFVFVSFALFFSIAGLGVFLRSLKAYKKFLASDLMKTEPVIIKGSAYYSIEFVSSPVFYHLLLIVFALSSSVMYFFHFNSQEIDNYFTWLVQDLHFQISAALLFVVLGVLNPFMRDFVWKKSHVDEKEEAVIDPEARKKKLFLTKLCFCIGFVFLFLANGWISWPNFSGRNIFSLAIGITLLAYVLRNLYFMYHKPEAFLKENFKTVIKFIALMHGAIFTLTPLVPAIMLPASMLGSGVEEIAFTKLLIPLVFIGLNVFLVSFEYINFKSVYKFERKK